MKIHGKSHLAIAVSVGALTILLSPLCRADDQTDDLIRLGKIGVIPQGEAEHEPTVDEFKWALDIYRSMKKRSPNSAATRMAVVHVAAIANSIPESLVKPVWKELLADVGITSEWHSIAVRCMHVIELNNMEAMGENHGAKQAAASVLSGMNRSIWEQSITRDASLINRQGVPYVLRQEMFTGVFKLVEKVRDK